MSKITEGLQKLFGNTFPHKFWILGANLESDRKFQCVPVISVLLQSKEECWGLACYHSEAQALENRTYPNLKPLLVGLDEARTYAQRISVKNSVVRALVLVQNTPEVHWLV